MRSRHSTICPFVVVVADTLNVPGLAANVPGWESHDCGSSRRLEDCRSEDDSNRVVLDVRRRWRVAVNEMSCNDEGKD